MLPYSALCCQLSCAVSCLASLVVTLLCCIEFQHRSTSNTHPEPQAMFSAIALIAKAKIPDRLCHIGHTCIDEHIVGFSLYPCWCIRLGVRLRMTWKMNLFKPAEFLFVGAVLRQWHAVKVWLETCSCYVIISLPLFASIARCFV